MIPVTGAEIPVRGHLGRLPETMVVLLVGFGKLRELLLVLVGLRGYGVG